MKFRHPSRLELALRGLSTPALRQTGGKAGPCGLRDTCGIVAGAAPFLRRK
jgi:hypothetical protein